jgi:hypothetical protein
MLATLIFIKTKNITNNFQGKQLIFIKKDPRNSDKRTYTNYEMQLRINLIPQSLELPIICPNLTTNIYFFLL